MRRYAKTLRFGVVVDRLDRLDSPTFDADLASVAAGLDAVSYTHLTIKVGRSSA